MLSHFCPYSAKVILPRNETTMSMGTLNYFLGSSKQCPYRSQMQGFRGYVIKISRGGKQVDFVFTFNRASAPAARFQSRSLPTRCFRGTKPATDHGGVLPGIPVAVRDLYS